MELIGGDLVASAQDFGRLGLPALLEFRERGLPEKRVVRASRLDLSRKVSTNSFLQPTGRIAGGCDDGRA